jgi:hypothetical protein
MQLAIPINSIFIFLFTISGVCQPQGDFSVASERRGNRYAGSYSYVHAIERDILLRDDNPSQVKRVERSPVIRRGRRTGQWISPEWLDL